MYLTLVSFPGVIKGLWAVRTNEHKCTFMSTSIICSSIMFVRWWGVFWCLPEAKRAPTRGTTKAFAAIGQLIWQETRVVTSFLQVGLLLWSRSTWVTSSFVTGVPPLRIPDQTFLVTASSYGRCGGTLEINTLWKTALARCTIKKIASYLKHIVGKNTFPTPHSQWIPSFFLSEYLHVGVLPSFHLFIFH